jgi:hypothetical protein
MVALANFMRLSLLKGAHAVKGWGHVQEIRVLIAGARTQASLNVVAQPRFLLSPIMFNRHADHLSRLVEIRRGKDWNSVLEREVDFREVYS